ncbi:MAG: hypothetical protein AAGK32_20020, partial [Actinomycetota bacterium]
MDEAALRALIDGVRDGSVRPDDAVASLRRLPFVDLGFARLDTHRAVRQGRGEVVYGPGKRADECAAIVTELRAAGTGPVLVTRADDDQVAAIRADHPDASVVAGQPATVLLDPAPPRDEHVAVVTAGTADGPVADEAAATLAAHGLSPVRLSDVGVAGLHRLLDSLDELVGAPSMPATTMIASAPTSSSSESRRRWRP